MKYSIITINDKRRHYKQIIRKYVEMPEEVVASVDGQYLHAHGPGLEANLKDSGLEITANWRPRLGEVGLWMSSFLRWERVARMNEPLIVFEDDAIIGEKFRERMDDVLSQLPEGWDFVALWVPDYQRAGYRYSLIYDSQAEPTTLGIHPEHHQSDFDFGAPDLARAYQEHGTVAIMYSPGGGSKLVDLARRHGLRTSVDCFLFQEAHKGNLDGYSLKPDKIFVDYDWPESTILDTDRLSE